jgi:hypothetical protein
MGIKAPDTNGNLLDSRPGAGRFQSMTLVNILLWADIEESLKHNN